MDYRQFMRLMEAGQEPEREVIQTLEEFVKEFPYFQSAQIMLAKSMHDHQHVRFEKQLKIASAYAGDRKFLYDLIHSQEKNIITQQTAIPESPFILKNMDEEIKNEIIINEEIKQANSQPVVQEKISIDEEVKHEFTNIPIFFEDEPTADEFNEMPVADPHDIIRKRLIEILGLKEEKKETLQDSENVTEKITRQKEISEIPEKKELNIVDDFKVGEKENIPETIPFKTDDIYNKKDDKDILQTLVEASTKSVDVIQKGELEYALEATLIQSIEKLPVIEPVKSNVEISDAVETKPQTFYDWLKVKAIGDYGRIEEVHAYDDTKEVKKIISSDDNISLNEEEPKSGNVETLIDRFIETEPRIIPSKTEFYSPVAQAKKSITEDEDLVSETLAKIYLHQGNYLKAKASYQKLSLLFPEKKGYFAALIEAIDRDIKNPDKDNI
jgi:hypothetical protein